MKTIKKISKSSRISVLLPSLLVGEVKRESVVNNVTQGSIVKNALELWFRNKLKRDARALSKIDFFDLPSEDEWINIQSKIN